MDKKTMAVGLDGFGEAAIDRDSRPLGPAETIRVMLDKAVLAAAPREPAHV